MKMYYIGIDLGGTNIAAALVDEEGQVSNKISIKTDAGLGKEAVTGGLMRACDMVAGQSGVDKSEIKSVGIGAPGMMNFDTGVVLYCPNIPAINHVDITSEIKKKYGVPVYINNDANCAALGEVVAGGAKGAKDALFVILGTGVGGGIVIDGKIYTGHNGVAGEIGHIVISLDGRECGCGRKGCWEAYASASGLIKTTKEFMLRDRGSVMWKLVGGDIDQTSGRTAFEAMRKGDKSGSEAVDLYINHLAAGVIDMINIFQPEVICIGGGISHEGEYLLKPLQKVVDAGKYGRASDEISHSRLVCATLGNDAGIVGAAMLGR
ncbi:MAG: ROK family protein [Oscillospiraceae bacterium]|jgi:glucokinase|nr:ROK family protein [Oscillospiraceae bacterium]